MARPTTLQTSLKTVRVLEAFVQFGEQSASLSQIADILGWARPATHQYLTTLVHGGWVQQDARRQYRLGARAAVFGRYAIAHAGVPEAITRQMRQLVATLEEPISFAVRNGPAALIVERYEPKRPLAVRREAERLLPLDSTSGLVLLAFDSHATPEERRPFADVLAEVRSQEYALQRDTWMGDAIEAVAVPVMQGTECLGALSVIAPQGRMNVPAAIATLRKARAEIERELPQP